MDSGVIFICLRNFLLGRDELINPIAIFLFAILVALYFTRNRLLGMFIAGLLLLLSAYMVLALISELSEFPTFNRDAQLMLGSIGTWLGLNIVTAIIMLRKWIFSKISSPSPL